MWDKTRLEAPACSLKLDRMTQVWDSTTMKEENRLARTFLYVECHSCLQFVVMVGQCEIGNIKKFEIITCRTASNGCKAFTTSRYFFESLVRVVSRQIYSATCRGSEIDAVCFPLKLLQQRPGIFHTCLFVPLIGGMKSSQALDFSFRKLSSSFMFIR